MQQEVEQNSSIEEIAPGIIEDNALISNINAPSAAVIGTNVQVIVQVCCQAPPLTECDNVFLRVNGSKETGGQSIGSGNCQSFTITRTIGSEGISLNIEVIETDLTGETVTDSKQVFIRATESGFDAGFSNISKAALDFLNSPAGWITVGTLGIVTVTDPFE